MGGEYIIIDDPVKNREDADSATMREKVYDWYTSTLYTRLEKDGCILLTLTRWHEDDLAGKLLKAAQEGADQWTILELPAVCEYRPKPYDVRQEGEALWKWKYDEEALEKMKVTVGSRDWAALYQQHPTPGEGGTFKREWWNYYKVLPDGLYDFVQIMGLHLQGCPILRLCGRAGLGEKGKQPLSARPGAWTHEFYRDLCVLSAPSLPSGRRQSASSWRIRQTERRSLMYCEKKFRV